MCDCVDTECSVHLGRVYSVAKASMESHWSLVETAWVRAAREECELVEASEGAIRYARRTTNESAHRYLALLDKLATGAA